MSYKLLLNGNQLLKRIRKLGKATGTKVGYDDKPGKGNHGRLYYGSRFTTIKALKKEIGTGLLNKMLKDLGVDKRDLK